MSNKCVLCHIVCEKDEKGDDRCIVIGDKSVCGDCANHVKMSLENRGMS